MSESKLEFLEASKSFWNPDKTQFWQDAGVDLVIDRREGYCLYDLDGARLIDVHLNGGTYNLGHRNPELIEVLNAGARRFDMGNHHFPALARTALAEALAACTPEGLQYTIYGAGGAEAVELAIKSARNATGKRRDRLHHQGIPRALGPVGEDRRRTLLQDVPLRGHSWGSSSRCRSTTSTRWRTRSGAGTWPPSSWRPFPPPTASPCRTKATCRA